ncbi:MAG: nucleotidyl transferase AbiEii/AbiGii toxin family protein, partial [Lentisphaeria bacterium]|nr:nucleotidyl transferase AbiEii/AbiGii toxin family protein [Lentisphaeria bacterium]
MFDPRYMEQVNLVLGCMPAVADQACFALKGGSAINLFVHDMPRVSVDIDLTYLPVAARDISLASIEFALRTIKSKVESGLDGVVVNEKRIQGHVAKLTVISSAAEIKIEPNLILRGALGEPVRRELCPAAQVAFEAYCMVPVVSDADLYAGKICAALDRQHPRDLFDVKILLDDTGITPAIRHAFVVYLAGHNRPMHELLSPNLVDITDTFERQFAGMAREPVTIGELVAIR